MSDVHALVEVLELGKQCAIVAQAVLADGKVDVRDLVKLAQLWSPAKAALQDAKLVPAELTNIDSAALQVLVSKVIEVVEAIVAIAA